MPGFDRTGPAGWRSGKGRGRGPCGRGLAFGRGAAGRGFGMGISNDTDVRTYAKTLEYEIEDMKKQLERTQEELRQLKGE